MNTTRHQPRQQLDEVRSLPSILPTQISRHQWWAIYNVPQIQLTPLAHIIQLLCDMAMAAATAAAARGLESPGGFLSTLLRTGRLSFLMWTFETMGFLLCFFLTSLYVVQTALMSMSCIICFASLCLHIFIAHFVVWMSYFRNSMQLNF